MKRLLLLILTGFTLICSLATLCVAQEQRHGYVAPKVILVQLRSEQRRLKFYTDANRPEKAAALAVEAAKIRMAAINDFKDHFKFCPVYFYIDTNVEKIKAKQFDNVLFTTDGVMAQNLHLQDYYIVYYGYPAEDKHTHFVTRESTYEEGTGNVMGIGLVVLNENYEQMHPPFPYYVWKLVYRDWFGKRDSKYRYRSKKYDMDYYPLAKVLNEEFVDYFVKGVRIITQFNESH